MLGALTQDLADIPGLELRALRDERLKPYRRHSSIQWIPVRSHLNAMDLFSSMLDQADAAWPIAPETGGVLEELCRLIETRRKILLNTSARGVRLAASKLATLETLGGHDIPVIPTQPWADGGVRPPFAFPIVIKIDDGVGCENTHIIRNADQWDAFRRAAHPGRWVVQPLMNGEKLSLCGLFREGAGVLLSVNRQRLREQWQSFSLEGCSVNAISDVSGSFAALIQDIARAIPDLWGYVGIDLIRGADGLKVLEINPRLTTSYAGLRSALGINPAKLVIDLWQSRRLPRLSLYPARTVQVGWDPPR